VKVAGSAKLAKQLRDAPEAVHRNVVKSIKLNTEQAARMARSLVPVKSGELKSWIFTQYDDEGMMGSVEAAPPARDEQIKAKAVEFGRKKGNRGATVAQPYIRTAQKLQAPKFSRSIKSAIRRGLKEATNG
jgi:hypothetical protein